VGGSACIVYVLGVGNFVVATGGGVGNMSRQLVAGGFAPNFANFFPARFCCRGNFSLEKAQSFVAFRCCVWLFSLEPRFFSWRYE